MDIQTIILAILREAESQKAAPLLRTSLIKYLYLADVYTAEESGGTPVSNAGWRFLHFGPFSQQVAQTLDDLVSQRMIYADQKESQAGDKEFVLYSLSRREGIKGLRDIGFPGSVLLRLHADMKRYGNNLSRLLDYVYFHTTPMIEAKPGENLNFESCEKIRPQDVKAIDMKKLRPKAVKQTRGKLRELILQRKSQDPIKQGPFDEAYYIAIGDLDGEPLEVGLAGKANLKI